VPDPTDPQVPDLGDTGDAGDRRGGLVDQVGIDRVQQPGAELAHGRAQHTEDCKRDQQRHVQ
jgi:hypothetical protein